MPTYAGSWVGSDFQGRLVVEVSDLPAINSDTGPFEVTSNWYAEFSANTWDGGATFDTNGSFDAPPTTVSIGSPSNPVTRAHLGTRRVTVTPSFSSEVTVTVQGTYTGVNNIGSGTVVRIDTSFTVPRKPYALPLAPRNFVYGSVPPGTSAVLQWDSNYTGGDGPRPWRNIHIDRWDSVNGWVAPIVSLNWDAVTWTDTSLQLDRAYRYRIVAQNQSGYSPFAEYNYTIYTKPTAPRDVTAHKQANGDIIVSWVNHSSTAKMYVVWHATNGVWDNYAYTTKTQWTHTSPSVGDRHNYRVFAMAPDWTRSDYSATSGDVQLQTPPGAPTNLAPSAIALSRVAEHQRTWRHTSRDGSAQTSYEIQTQTSTDGGSTWSALTSTGRVYSTSSSQVVAANTYAAPSTLIRWQVRTWGSHSDPSGWSAQTTYEVSAAPVVTITSPTHAQVLPEDVVTVQWTYDGVVPQASWVAILKSSQGVSETRSGTGNSSSVTFTSRLTNNTQYTVDITAVDANGLSSAVASRQFSTQFVGPPAALAVAGWDGGLGAVTLTITNPTPTGTVPAAVSTTVERLVDGRWYEIGTYGLDPTLTDPIPTLGQATYRLTTRSALDASTSVDINVNTPNREDWIWVNYGPGFGLRARVRLSAATSSKYVRPRQRHHFAGRKREVSYVGELRERSIAVTALTEESDTIGNRAAWERAVDEGGLICYRDYLGRRIFGSLGEVSFDSETDDLSSLVFDVQEDDHAE